MRIAVGQLWQETNTFNHNFTELSDFENWGVAGGANVIARYGETGEIGGFLHGLKAELPDADVVGLARFVCWPWGPVAETAWDAIQSRFADELTSAGPVDAVFLALHGAMSAEHQADVTGTLLAQVRERVGPHVPVIGSLDLHANLTRQMMESADLLVGYHTLPHLDAFQTGERCARGLRRLLVDKVRPVHRWIKLPMITAAEIQNTFTGPPAALYRRLQELEQRPDVLSAGLYMAMPWFDCPELGWALTLTTTDDDPDWNETLQQMGEACWNIRHALESVERLSPRAAVDRALQDARFPVVIGDGADATNSGAPGDSTQLLRELLSRPEIPGGALTFLVDPRAVEAAYRVGQGSAFDQRVGGCFAREHYEPVRVQGTVEWLGTVAFVLDGHIGHKLPIHMGRGATIHAGDVHVLLVERSGPGSSPLLYEAAGLDPRRCGIVIAKSPAGFRADYEAFAAQVLLSDCDGCASPHWKQMVFESVQRPLWPLDNLQQISDADWCGGLHTRLPG
ncbi:MAG: M81 family metallopeptidase [Planctomycetaceae bacterium]